MFRILQLWVCVVYNYDVCNAIHALTIYFKMLLQYTQWTFHGQEI